MPVKKEPATSKRLVKGSAKIYSDLYKLDVAKMKKNVSWNKMPDYVDIEHCHFFHTFDSNGRAQQNSTKIGSHYHRMKLVKPENPNDPPIVVCDSGPLKKIVKIEYGRSTFVEVPYDPSDNHVHEVTYLSSETVILRKMNPEIINLQAIEANKTAPIPGVL